MGFTGFDGDATARWQGVFYAVHRDGGVAGLDEKNFEHVGVVVGERDGVRGETRLREVGEWGEFAGVDERLLGDAGVVADSGERGLGEGGEFHVG